jgi:hypothetical protein
MWQFTTMVLFILHKIHDIIFFLEKGIVAASAAVKFVNETKFIRFSKKHTLCIASYMYLWCLSLLTTTAWRKLAYANINKFINGKQIEELGIEFLYLDYFLLQ